MHKAILDWKVADLKKRFAKIDFPEYQREPTVWSRAAKQRLIDSMVRRFDIASLYIYDTEDGSYDCIDGRQRIGAIMSFLGENKEDEEDNGFAFKILNEIYTDKQPVPFGDLNELTFKEITKRSETGNADATNLINAITNYSLTVVLLSKSQFPEEFNLQFTRLNLGTILNSGEKLHAMVGDMRDACFKPGGLGHHAFLKGIKIPTRRYSREQVAAQILAQVFSFKEGEGYARTRHFDLQKFFKDYATLDADRSGWVDATRNLFDLLANSFDDLGILGNRAITVSTVLLAWQLDVNTTRKAKIFARFIDEFLCRLRWQIGRELDIDQEYRYLSDFQRHVTQASVEKFAVEARHKTLEDQYSLFLKTNELRGDAEYLKRTKKKPTDACRSS